MILMRQGLVSFSAPGILSIYVYMSRHFVWLLGISNIFNKEYMYSRRAFNRLAMRPVLSRVTIKALPMTLQTNSLIRHS